MNSINPFWQNTETSVAQQYLDALSLIERLRRLLVDVIKDEFERLGVLEINAVQALLLFDIGENEVTAGELKSRGFAISACGYDYQEAKIVRAFLDRSNSIFLLKFVWLANGASLIFTALPVPNIFH